MKFFPPINDITFNIFTFLDLRSLVRSSLVCKNWKDVSENASLWREILNRTDLSLVETKNSFISIAWKYRDISLIFSDSERFHPAIEACKISAKHDPHNGAYGFRDICQKACDMNRYDIALKCQQLAKHYYADAGNAAMSYFIKSQAAKSDFLEIYQQLIEMSVNLIEDDREYGLQSLMEVAKKLADLNRFGEAMHYTQLARTLRDSRDCTRGRDHSDDIHPFTFMGKHMLSLKQYKLAEECARKIDVRHYHPEWLYAEIVVKQIQEEHFVNDRLFSEIRPKMAPFITAAEGLVFGLIACGRYDEAKDFTKLRMQLDRVVGKYDFKRKIKENLGVSVEDWFAGVEPPATCLRLTF
jgi:tetratricopeptide (TPR) repeat protein